MSSHELLWSFICFGHRDKSCSDHFVLNVASRGFKYHKSKKGIIVIVAISKDYPSSVSVVNAF
ncbi:conserved hypothetical protein [Trichinella spiralis]|uniref:hypothetical protein n=1 Tax=Trichinella spiralis TaxID=6334 RepID=UPI0001EFD2E6|nr:conserved hypothetical protein [Trichinella spiralis]